MSAIKNPTDVDRLQRILATVETVLPPEDAAFLAMRIDAQPELRAVRIEQRDELVRRALREFGDAQPTRAAKLLAAMIDRRLSKFDTRGSTSGPLAAMVDQIIKLNAWRSLGWRQIHNIFSARLCNSAEKNCNGATL